MRWLGFGPAIKEYQGLIGTVVTGSLGFYGLIKTLEINARNTNKTLEANAANALTLIDRERKGLKATLLAELLILYGEVHSQLKVARSYREQQNFVVPKYLDGEGLVRAYRAMVGKVGLLDEAELSAVVTAYADFEGLAVIWKWMEEMQSGKFDMSKENRHFSIYVSRAEMTVMRIKMAIERLGGKVPDELPSLSGILKNKLAG